MDPSTTPAESLPVIVEQSKRAQRSWAALSTKARARHLLALRECILNHLDETIELISRENGKPYFEAMINDLLPSVELITYFARRAPKVLKDKSLFLRNPILWHRKSLLTYAPMGVIAVISPWNFPFFLPLGEIVMALVAGNSVIFKPSEYTPATGLKIQEFIEEAGFPTHVLQTIVGGGDLGRALIDQKPAKIFFTGSVETGKKIMAAASRHLIPVNLELGGKDAMIVFPDADLDYATSAALWGAYGNSGQVCASTERLVLHEKIADPFLSLFKEKARKLRQGSSALSDQGPLNDLGPITVPRQKEVYRAQIDEAKAQGAEVILGGEFAQDGNFLQPTLLGGEKIESLKAYREESFGPMAAVTRFRSAAEAVRKANDSEYGLLASVITGDLALGEDIARQLEVGTVTINEVAYTAAVPEAPWGGTKNSGFGLKHSDRGLYEFVITRHINKPRTSGFAFFKSYWWFPYSKYQYEVFRQFFELYRRSWIARIKALPQFLWNFVTFYKKEKRL